MPRPLNNTLKRSIFLTPTERMIWDFLAHRSPRFAVNLLMATGNDRDSLREDLERFQACKLLTMDGDCDNDDTIVELIIDPDDFVPIDIMHALEGELGKQPGFVPQTAAFRKEFCEWVEKNWPDVVNPATVANKFVNYLTPRTKQWSETMGFLIVGKERTLICWPGMETTDFDLYENEKPKLEVAKSQYRAIEAILDGQATFEGKGYEAPLAEFVEREFPELSPYATTKLLGSNRSSESRARNRASTPSKRRYEIVRSNGKQVSICLRGFTAWDFVPIDRVIKPRGHTPKPVTTTETTSTGSPEVEDNVINLNVRRLLSEIIVDPDKLRNLDFDELELLKSAGMATFQEIMTAVEALIEEMKEARVDSEIEELKNLIVEMEQRLEDLEARREHLVGPRLAA